jgi:predicted porin
VFNMKKSLLALAVCGAFAGAAHAQSNVTVYGIVDVGVNFDNGRNAAGRTWSVASGQQSGSRIGFKGSEDLGDGYAAIFTLENGFNADDGTLGNGGRLFGRQAWVGLSSNKLGALKLGRQYSAIYNALNVIDPFAINQAGDEQRAYGYGLGKLDPIARSDNTVTYSSPDFAGASVYLGYKAGETAGSISAGSGKFVGLAYVNGPLNVQLAYQRSDAVDFGAASGALGAIVVPTGMMGSAPTLAAPAKALVKNAFLGATYDFGVVKAHASYGDTRAQIVGDMQIRNYMLGVSAPLGASGNVYASWNRNDVRDISAGQSDLFAVGYAYTLSKRTNLYTSLGYTQNDNGVRLNAAANGGSDREFQAGIRHQF